MSSPLGFTDWLSFVASFALVLGIIAMLSYALKRLGSNAIGGRNDNPIRVLENHSVGNRQRIVLIRAKDREILLGVTMQQISTLAVWSVDQLARSSGAPDAGDVMPAHVTSGASLTHFFRKLNPTHSDKS